MLQNNQRRSPLNKTIRKPRLLIPISFNFGARYLVRTGLVERIKEFCDPVVLLGWEDSFLREDFRTLNIEYHPLPQTHYSVRYQQLRKRINVWFYQERLRSPTIEIRERRADLDRTKVSRAIHKLNRFRNSLRIHLPGAVTKWLQEEKDWLLSETNMVDFRKLLDELRPDAGFCVAPFYPEEELIMRAVSMRDMPVFTSIISFDNLSRHGWMPTRFNHYMVWNRFNQNELLRAYPDVKPEQVTIVGPAQFDFYWDQSNLWPEAEWRNRLGLPKDRTIILYGGNIQRHVPHEPSILKQLDEAIESGKIPGKPLILLRLHPVDRLDRWKPLLVQTENIVVDYHEKQQNPGEQVPAGQVLKHYHFRSDDIEKFVSTIFHSQIHINVCSTMTLDGAVFNHPQIGPAYDDTSSRRYDRSMRELYMAEHFQPIVRSGGVELVYSREELIEAVRRALENPGERSVQRQKMLQDVCTYLDGQSTQRVINELRNLLERQWGVMAPTSNPLNTNALTY